MAEFTQLVTDVLGVSLTIGTTTLTLGAIALGASILGVGVGFYRRLGGRRLASGAGRKACPLGPGPYERGRRCLAIRILVGAFVRFPVLTLGSTAFFGDSLVLIGGC
jgi:hypothetical protein